MTTVNILLVEDDEIDATDVRRTFNKMNIPYHMHVAKNGMEALEYLGDNTKQRPDITLIDINMPRMNGFELLKQIRETPELKEMKCYMITTSNEKPDKTQAQQLGVTGYIVKPLKLNNPANMDAFNLMIDFINLKR